MNRDNELMMEAFQKRMLSNAGAPDAALVNTGAGENAEGDDASHHRSRKDAFEGAGEEIGDGHIKVRLDADARFDCSKAGVMQDVRFAKGTIFNCDGNAGDFYNCESDEYGTIAVFPDHVTVLSGEESAENAHDATVKEGDFYEAHGEKYVCVGVEEVDGQTMVHGVMLADAGDSFPMSDVTKVD